MRLTDFLEIGRIHTASLTMPAAALGYLIGGGTWDEPMMAFWLFFALLFHYVGFLLNNIFDLPYDRQDASKAHFALVDGRISLKDAWTIEIIGVAMALALVILVSWGKLLAALTGMAAILLGVLYNAVSKRTTLSPLLITASFTSLFLFPYLTRAAGRKDLALLVALFMVLLMLFQIGYEGYLKDIEADKLNLLRRLGSRVVDGVFKPTKGSIILGLPLRLLLCFVAILILVQARTEEPLAILLTLFLITVLLYLSALVMSAQSWRRDVVVARCALNEVFAYFTLVAALQGLLGWLGVSLFIFLPMLWFIVWNRILWGTKILPRV